jgi:hypothetical protein
MRHFRAPWSLPLILISALGTGVCLAASVGVWLPWWRHHGPPTAAWVAFLPLLIVVGCAPFTVRGYTITDTAVLVHRLFWATRLPRAGLLSVYFEPKAMRWSIRTFGNGGMFSFTGHFRNRALGAYRAYVTDPQRTVVLCYADKKIVVSPDQPEEFTRELTFSTAKAQLSR